MLILLHRYFGVSILNVCIFISSREFLPCGRIAIDIWCKCIKQFYKLDFTLFNLCKHSENQQIFPEFQLKSSKSQWICLYGYGPKLTSALFIVYTLHCLKLGLIIFTTATMNHSSVITKNYTNSFIQFITWMPQIYWFSKFSLPFRLCVCLSACMSMQYVCLWCLWRLVEDIGCPVVGVTDGCQLP